MNDNYNETIRQGFLCPFCFKDLGNPSNLLNHVEVYHKENAKNDVVEHIRDLFGKAKQKIKSFDGNESNDKSDEIIQQKNISMALYPEKHELGKYRNFKDIFFKERDNIVRKTTEDTNQLIIRLDKLLTVCPDDVNRKKELEKQVVPWAPDKDSNCCSYCQQTFNITRRRHHCRLCGKIICANCSKFLSYITAKKLINPAFAAQILESFKNVDELNKNSQLEKANTLSSIRKMISSASTDSFSKMKAKSEKLISQLINRDESQNSISSLIIQEENEQFRICARCKELLEKRDMLMDQIASTPIIIQLYESLIEKLNEIKKLVPIYCKMANSLNEGENLYTLSNAIQYRKNIALYQKDVDSISHNIENLGVNNEYSPTKVTAMEIKLQKSIRRYAIMVVQDIISDIPDIPSESTYYLLQEKYKKQMLERIENEKKEQLRK
ncbi:Rabenosyn-5 [Strongyloides ratti]|uniref:Rabenosyn-5 n=1 Tax=Strongyloides ratti TaxID=34506 RepID=A0A090LU76_STRRB|nr:Rabenosyn-5 [Strongyloides ratti]CEF71179.1 Rabenosyn-5 [Strongyloides ratti]